MTRRKRMVASVAEKEEREEVERRMGVVIDM